MGRKIGSCVLFLDLISSVFGDIGPYLNRLHLDSSTFQAMRTAHLQVSQSLPVTVAMSTPNGSSDIKTDEENQR